MSLGTLWEWADRIERSDWFKKCISIIKVAYDKIKEQKRWEWLDSLLLDSKKIVQVSELVEELKKSALSAEDLINLNQFEFDILFKESDKLYFFEWNNKSNLIGLIYWLFPERIWEFSKFRAVSLWSIWTRVAKLLKKSN